MPTNYDLGTAYGTIELNASSLSRAAAGFDLLSNKMLLLGGAALAGFGYAVKSAADFEQQMSRFKAVGNATVDQMEAIRQKSLQLGRDSAYGASEVVKAFTELAYAGATTKEIVSGLGDATVFLAAAGEIPLATAATVLINTMRQFDVPASRAVHLANEIARAANASTISIDDLNTSLRYIGPTAAELGFSFRDVTQAIAVLGNEGIRGSTAGTTLRGVLVGLNASSGPAKEALHTLGLDTNEVGNNFFTAEGKIRSFKEISEILRGAMGHLGQEVFDVNGKLKSQDEINKLLFSSTTTLSDRTKLQAFSALFQRRAMSAAFALAKDGSKAFTDLSNSQQYNTTAQEIMKVKLDNLNGSLKILRASIETFAIVVGEKFTPYLKAAADVLREIVNVFIKLPGPVQTAIGAVLALGGGTLVLAGTLGKIASISIRTYKGVNDLGKGFQLMGGLLRNFVSGLQLLGTTLLANPIFLFIVVIAALAVLFYLLYTRSETFRRGIQKIGEAAKEAARWLLGAFKEAWNWIKTNWPDLVLILLGPFGVAIIAWRHFKDEILGVVRSVLDWVKRNWDLLTPLLLGPFGLFVIFIRRWGDDVVRIISSMVDKVVGFIKKLPYYFGYAIGFLIAGAILLQVRLIQAFIRLWTKIIDLTIQFTIDFLKLILKLLLAAPGFFLDAFTKIIAATIRFVEQMVAKIIDLGVRVIAAVIQFFSQLPGLILGFITTALAFFINWGAQMVSAMINAGSQVLSAAINFFSQLPGQIVGAVGDGYHLLYDWALNIMHGLIDGLKSLAGKAKDIASDIGNGVINGVKSIGHVLSPSKDMIEVGRNYTQGFIIGLARDMHKLKDHAKRLNAGAHPRSAGREAYQGGGTTSNVRGDTNIYIQNPVAEAAEESISRTMQKLAYVGIAG